MSSKTQKFFFSTQPRAILERENDAGDGDIRFLNLLEESHVDFRCIDFPWFCKENLPLIKAVVLYEKLEIRINV